MGLKVERGFIHEPKNTPKINTGESILDFAKRVTELHNRKKTND